MKKGEIKRGLISLILTSVVILTLVLMTPAGAVELNISTDKAAYKVKEVVTFSFNVDLQNGERVPVTELTLKLNGIEKCKFKPSGEIISGCQDMEITKADTMNYGYGYNMQGTGFGHDGTTGVEQTMFGYGYGYGYGYGEEQPVEMQYEIKWTTTDSDFGDYKATLEAFAQNGEKEFTYISGQAPFKIRKGVLATEAKANINAEAGTVTMEDETFGSNPKDMIEFFGDLRSVNSDAAGTIAVNAKLYGEDGKYRTIEIRLKPKILDDFHRDMIEVEGLASVDIGQYRKARRTRN